MDDYLEINRANWDDRAPIHAGSTYYGFERFVNDPIYISDVVRFDRERLGDIAGLRAVHLQCHIGTDTISLARLGAQMTGLDLSPASLAEARRLASETASDVSFIESDVYSAPAVLERASFDLVYTGIGAICWLPSVRRWAEVVATLLKPGGRLFIREAHPMLDSSDVDGQRLVIENSYFEEAEPVAWDEGSTYVETNERIEHSLSVQWAHGIGETITALMEAGMELTAFTEHDSTPWQALPGLMVEDSATGEWRLRERPRRLAATFTLQARRIKT